MVVVLLLVVVAIGSWRTAERMRTDRWSGGIRSPLDFVGSSFDVNAIQEVADGKGDGSFGAAIRELADRPQWGEVAEPNRLCVVFGPPQGERSIDRTWGWPFTVLRTRLNTGYQDVFRREGPVLSDSYASSRLGRWEWSGFGRWYSGMRFEVVGETWDYRHLELLGIVANVAAGAALWRLSLCAVRIAAKRRNTIRVSGWVSAGLAGACFATVAAGSLWFGVREVDSASSKAGGATVVEGLTRDRARELGGPKGDEAEMARLILNGRGDASGYLAASFGEVLATDFSQGNFGWPLNLCTVYSHKRVPTDSEGNPSPRFARVKFLTTRDTYSVTIGFQAGAERRTRVFLSNGLFAGLGVVWLAGWFVSSLTYGVIRMRVRRRERRGLCVWCGYPRAESECGGKE